LGCYSSFQISQVQVEITKPVGAGNPSARECIASDLFEKPIGFSKRRYANAAPQAIVNRYRESKTKIP
jgi:hypothetical protein